MALLRDAMPFFLGGVSSSVNSSIDVLILSHLVPLKTLGLYVAGYFFLTLSLYLPGAFAQSTYPVQSRAAASGQESLQKVTQDLFRAIAVVAFLIIVTVEPIARLLISLFYGDQFGPSTTVLQVVIWSVALVVYNNTVGQAIYAAGGQWALVIVNFVGALSNIIANLALIPLLGIMGSSLATIISFGVACVLHGYYGRRYGCAVSLKPLLKILPAAAAGLLLGFLASAWIEPLGLLAAPAAYGATLLLAGYFDEQELAAMRAVRMRLFGFKLSRGH
jgi:O-antigen/teichoic acid export membrane protein